MLLDDESPRQYKALLQGFRDSLQPQGMAEEIQVEELASLKWRYLRLLRAES
jgi:hypothetical protein